MNNFFVLLPKTVDVHIYNNSSLQPHIQKEHKQVFLHIHNLQKPQVIRSTVTPYTLQSKEKGISRISNIELTQIQHSSTAKEKKKNFSSY